MVILVTNSETNLILNHAMKEVEGKLTSLPPHTSTTSSLHHHYHPHPVTTMDLYLPSTEPGLTLQEMIDCDIKCGIDFNEGLDTMMSSSDLNSLDLSGMSSLEAELDLKSFEPLFDPLEKLEDMDVTDDHSAEELNVVNSWMNMSSMSNYNLDIENSVMVNPSAVLPTNLPSRSTRQEPSTTMSSSVSSTTTTPTVFIKTEPQQVAATSLQTPQSQVAASGTTITTQVTVMRPRTTVGQTIRHQNAMVSAQSTTHSSSQPTIVTRPTLATSQMVVQTTQRTAPQLTLASTASTTTTHTTTPIITARTTTPHTILNNRYKSTGKPRKDLRPEERVFPKPAYSYSCLIALALKNSTTGSLPVSEIYSFMCEHFPYFRTAPNGWKNSVRHNLSLNKCFEKIEKPVVAGSNQRKGCLWALNPAKAHKMDEEVQKWSKKDLQGIKDAMAYPEVLEALERGEMKFESNGGVSSCSEDEDEDEEVDPLAIDTPITPTVGTVKRGAQTVLSNQQQHIRQSLQNGRSLSTSIAQSPSTHTNARSTFTAQSLKRNSVTSSEEPEYILPDSTMTEISLQSNGALVDDLGNEIKIESESPIQASPSPRGLVVRKLPGVTPLRSATMRANYVYTPTISSPHQQHTLNRLVLTNGKLS
ncbi:forkhead box protein N4 isoform X2 [Cherax quadricarinatus]|nr:forkhead box protein N4-like isoform X2 [Cherax quadricarinatus]